MILVSILAMLQIHLLMTLLVLLLTPLSMVISRFIAKKSYHLFQKQTETRGIQTQLIEESLTQQNIIQSFNAQEEFIERLHEANDNYAGYSQSAIFLFIDSQSFHSFCQFPYLCTTSWCWSLAHHGGFYFDGWAF